MKWSKLVFSFSVIIFIYILSHIVPFLNYIDLVLIAIIIFYDYVKEKGIFIFLIPISFFNDYFLDLYFGVSGIIFIIIFLIKVLTSDNMYFKGHALRFLYYFTSMLIYTSAVSYMIYGDDFSIFVVLIHIILDLGVLYLTNFILETKFAFSHS